jgi:outer membrane biosynthesis protein TonB
MAGPRFTSVPVRIIVDREGHVKHVHVINGFPEQAKSISEALSQWTFKPYVKNGRALEVETGLLFDFKPDGVKARTDIANAKPVSEAR